MRKYKKFLFKLFSFIFRKSLRPPKDIEIKLIDDLIKECCRDDSVEYAFNFPIDNIWGNNMKQLRELIMNNNPRKFLEWDVVRNAMFVSYSLYVIKELMYLRKSSSWSSRWREGIIESPIGSPIYYPFYLSSSGNLIHHAYHLAQFEEKTRTQVNRMNYIFEFGGGYGSMCRLIHNIGFGGKYIIFDLPYLSALQRYYIKSIGIEIRAFEEFKFAKKGVYCISDLGQLDKLLSYGKGYDLSMFIATWSISETPVILRNIILSKISNFNTYLIAYQDMFGGVNNIEYFYQWRNTISNEMLWNEWEIKHIPGNRYLVGGKYSRQA